MLIYKIKQKNKVYQCYFKIIFSSFNNIQVEVIDFINNINKIIKNMVNRNVKINSIRKIVKNKHSLSS